MPRRVQGPAGVVHEFPDDATDAEIAAALDAESPAAASAAPERTWGDTAVDVAKGVVKGAGNTAYGLGKLVHDYTPVGRISDAIQPGAFDPANKPPELTPWNAAQKLGMGGEQIGEFFLPTGAAGKVGKVAEVGKSIGLTLAQGGSPAEAGVSGALTAVIPGASAASKLSRGLKESARDTMANSLRATRGWAKDESAKLAPEMLKRGIGGSFVAMRDLARSTAARVGQNLDDAYKAAAAAGETVPSDVIRGNIQLASDALHVPNAAGVRIPVPGHEAAIAKLDELDKFIEQLGPDIPVDKAAALKQTWDKIVSKAGLYGVNATAPASEKAQAFAFREAADSFRQILNTNPDIAALNKEASFWIGLRNVVNATKLRKVGQTGGLLKAGGAAVGAGVGGMTGDSYSERAVNGIIGGLAGQKFVQLVQSPYFMSKVSAPLKNALADALASGSTGRIAGATQRIIASLPSTVRQQFAN